MSSKRPKDDLAIGEDAFLDTVANLVGILIILVVIVGSGTKTAAELIAVEKIEKAEQELEKPVATAVEIEQDLRRQVEQLEQHALEVAYRDAERDAVLTRILVAREAIEEEKAKLDEQQRAAVEQQQQLNALEIQLSELVQQQGDLAASEAPTVILQHLPTPMAKTVFGQELHIMVRDGLISVIPWDSLVSMLKTEARRAVSRSTRREKITEQLGPVEGFLMDYSLISKRGVVSNGTSSAMAQIMELEKFELEPTAEVIREPIMTALGNNGRLRIELARYAPAETTINAWVYPNSFETYRELKGLLFQEGYMSSARPIPDGVRIGASPNGSRSAAQ